MSTANKVTAPVLWDNDSTFQGGKYFTVSVASIVVGTVNLPNGPVIPGSTSIPTYVPTLQIKDPVYNDLYLAITFEQWVALVGTTSVTPSGGGDIMTLNFIGGVNAPAGNTISATSLSGITIISVTKGGPAIYQYIYTDGTPNGVLDLTYDGGINDGEQVQVICKINQ